MLYNIIYKIKSIIVPLQKISTMQELKIDYRPIRLNRYIANAGICNRREADQFIKDGRISVNGTIITITT